MSEAASEREPDDVLEPGELVGEHLRIEGLIAKGGMGVVYLARDLRLARMVAVKVHRGHAGVDARARLEHEARAMAKINHPNVATVHEVGVHRDRPFIAMELVAGGTARSWRDAAPRSQREIVELWVQAARGLAAAHAVGIVHRDFKPDNVLITPQGVPGHRRVRVADFGLVRTDAEPMHATADGRYDRASLDASATTHESLGTPAYRAPEQADGIDGPAADQYAFCVSLHEALLGRLPDRAGVAAGALPRWLRRALERGLAESPRARWPTMDALVRALERGLGARRRRVIAVSLVLAAAGSIALGLAVGARGRPCNDAEERIAATWSDARRDAIAAAFRSFDPDHGPDAWSRDAAAIDDWVQAWIDARDASCRATRDEHTQDESTLERGMGCFDRRAAELSALLDSLATPDELAVRNAGLAVGELRSIRACSDATLLQAEVEPPEGEATIAEVERVRARLRELAALRNTSRLPAARAASEGVREQADATGYAPVQAETSLELGALAAAEHRAPEALAALEQAYNVAHGVGDEGTAAEAACQLARTAVTHGDAHMADVWLQLARDGLARGTADPDLAIQIERTAGLMHSMRGEFDPSIACFERAIELAAARPGESPTLALAREELATSLGAAGRLQEAVAAQAEAIATYDRVLGPGHPMTAFVHANRGMDLLGLGRTDEAIAEQRLVRRP